VRDVGRRAGHAHAAPRGIRDGVLLGVDGGLLVPVPQPRLVRRPGQEAVIACGDDAIPVFTSRDQHAPDMEPPAGRPGGHQHGGGHEVVVPRRAVAERLQNPGELIDERRADLINNSGVSTTQRLQDVGEEDYDFIFDTNTKGAFFVAQEVAKRMLARAKGAAPGTYVGGRIVNIASMAGLKVLPQIGVYCMSKAAVVQMTKAMAMEWGRFGINVNAICPGYIDTEINHHHWQTEQGQKLINMLPRKRVGQPADLDAVLMMLCANESHFINGAVIAADDGFGV